MGKETLTSIKAPALHDLVYKKRKKTYCPPMHAPLLETKELQELNLEVSFFKETK